MALQKQPINISFEGGIDTKTDPFQLPIGKFEFLKNKIYSKANRLDKRNGFSELTSLPDSSNNFITTFNGNLTALGTSINVYSDGSETWSNKGPITQIDLDTLSLVRSSTSQTSCDSVTHPNGLICTVFTDDVPGGEVYKYVIADSITGQNIIAPTVIPSADGSPRVFLLSNYFIIVYPVTLSIKYIAVSAFSPSSPTTPADITTNYLAGDPQGAFDGVVANNRLFIVYNGTDSGGAQRITYLTNTLSQGGTTIESGANADIITCCADETGAQPIIYVFGFDSSGPRINFIIFDFNLNLVHALDELTPAADITNITAVASNGTATIFYEVSETYSYNSVPTHFIKSGSLDEDGTIGSFTTLIRSVGIASKAVIYNQQIYLLATYQSDYQPTYFLINSSGRIVAKLGYSNGNGYSISGLPSAIVNNGTIYISYLIRTLLVPVNKAQGAEASAAVFAQTGVNLAKFNFNNVQLVSTEIGNNLQLSGGFVTSYDGYVAVEQGFHLWPDNVVASWSASGGSIVARPDGATNTNAYYYVAVYEWTDNQGNIHRSAPSVPFGVTTTGSGTSGSITVNVPYLRLTAKTANPVKIVIYRWSVAQQIYYQVTSISAPLLNSTTLDSVAFVDTQADASIIGNSILYTTGGVIENIGAPATSAMALYKSRLFLISAENKNLLWYSKQVIEGEPVEMSDLFTLFVAPTTAAQGNTGPLRCLAPMDDKLILFKDNALYYLVGNGPDNTGGNNDFSEPIFITSTIGSNNQNSIVFQPNGLMFESDKGIWILKRDLSTEYIGNPVEAYTKSATVLSAVNVPSTNQVRFTLDSGITLMYDYFFGQWSIFEGVSGISSTIFEGLHSFIDSYGRVFQESPGQYLDGSRPVLMSFRTGWINIAGLQGFERAYFFYLLGTYKSPHKLQIEVGYDYNSNPSQTIIITPDNFNPAYGESDGAYGDISPYGGPDSIEKWRIFFEKQKCEAFQITVTELFDPSYGTVAGEGLTLSGINMVVGLKKGYRTQSFNTSAG